MFCLKVGHLELGVLDVEFGLLDEADQVGDGLGSLDGSIEDGLTGQGI